MSEGIFIRGFSIEIYPDFYSPNIIPALLGFWIGQKYQLVLYSTTWLEGITRP